MPNYSSCSVRVANQLSMNSEFFVPPISFIAGLSFERLYLMTGLNLINVKFMKSTVNPWISLNFISLSQNPESVYFNEIQSSLRLEQGNIE